MNEDDFKIRTLVRKWIPVDDITEFWVWDYTIWCETYDRHRYPVYDIPINQKAKYDKESFNWYIDACLESFENLLD